MKDENNLRQYLVCNYKQLAQLISINYVLPRIKISADQQIGKNMFLRLE